MKTESNYRPTEDLSNLKVGDRVYCTLFGWGKVTQIVTTDPYPIKVEFENQNYTYNYTGKISFRSHQSLFTYNPFEPKSEYPKLMEVSNDNFWYKRVVFAKTQFGYHAYEFSEYNIIIDDISKTPLADTHNTWKYAREIQPEVEVPSEAIQSLDKAIEEGTKAIEQLQNIRKSLTN